MSPVVACSSSSSSWSGALIAIRGTSCSQLQAGFPVCLWKSDTSQQRVFLNEMAAVCLIYARIENANGAQRPLVSAAVGNTYGPHQSQKNGSSFAR